MELRGVQATEEVKQSWVDAYRIFAGAEGDRYDKKNDRTLRMDAVMPGPEPQAGQTARQELQPVAGQREERPRAKVSIRDCQWCAIGNRPTRSSVSDKFVHTDT